MKIRNLIVGSSLILTILVSSAFISPENAKLLPEDGGESFAKFLSHFEKTDLPFAIDLKDLKQNFNANQSEEINFQQSKGAKKARKTSSLNDTKYIPEANARFGRMGRPQLEPVARFYPNEKMIAVIYSSQRQFEMGYKQYNLLVFDLKGNIVFPKPDDRIGRSYHLAHSSYDETKACRIDEQGNIWQNTYKNVWGKDFRETGVADNQVIDFKLLDTKVFKFKENGAIVQLEKIPSDGRASLD